MQPKVRKKKTRILVDWCCMCKHSGETIDFLLLHCNYAYNLWSVVLSFWSALGDAKEGGGVVGVLEGGLWQTSCS